MGKYDEALSDFNHAIELNEKYAWAIANRGENYRLMGKYDEALSNFNRAIELDEKDAWAIASRGETHRLMGKYNEALKDFDRGINLNNNFDWAISCRGDTYRQLERWDKALDDYTTALKIDPQVFITLRHVHVHIELNDVNGAEKDLLAGIVMECKDSSQHYGRAVIFALSSRLPEALSELDIAFLDPSFASTHLLTSSSTLLRNLPEFKSLLAKYG